MRLLTSQDSSMGLSLEHSEHLMHDEDGSDFRFSFEAGDYLYPSTYKSAVVTAQVSKREDAPSGVRVDMNGLWTYPRVQKHGQEHVIMLAEETNIEELEVLATGLARALEHQLGPKIEEQSSQLKKTMG